MIKRLLLLGATLFGLVVGVARANEFLSPEKAFPVIAQSNESGFVEFQVQPQKGYYVYKESIKFKVLKSLQGVSQDVLGVPVLPPGKIKFDENFGKNLETYPKEFLVKVPAQQKLLSAGVIVQMELQGCADKGICYPPMQLNFTLAAPNVSVAGVLAEEPDVPSEPAGLADLWSARDDAGQLTNLLQNISPWILLGAFFILGLAMALTPCVLPMLPIMSSVVFGAKTERHQEISKLRSTILAISYVLGMAIMYSIAGMITAALGANIQVFLQNPWVLVGFALMLLALSASLFGLYELRLPEAIHNKIDRLAGKQEGGSVIGAFLLGAISTLIASPCVTAPLAGVLAFIAHAGSVPWGGVLLFVMALGMGLPLLLLAIGAKGLLPKTGAWMLLIQKIFGVLLIALAAWVVSPVFMKSSAEKSQGIHQLSSGLTFQVVTTSEQLDAALRNAKDQNKLVLLDFYADWCVTCKEMEVLTFSDPSVVEKLKTYELIQVDVTKNTANQQAILKRYGLFGPPAILFFDRQGQERSSQRVIGFMKASRFIERLE
ncbi:MAG: protein-disulfide reductase DsbD [Polynucleobacter sp.]|nr:MAG: protein-disulfide reductase DsbD [Polynucleobacter sp.]